MDYNALLAQSRDELEKLKSQKAVLQSKIDALVEKFGFDKNQELLPQINSLLDSLKKQTAEYEKELTELLKSLEELSISTDE